MYSLLPQNLQNLLLIAKTKGRVKANSIPWLLHLYQQFDILGYIYAMTFSADMNNIFQTKHLYKYVWMLQNTPPL